MEQPQTDHLHKLLQKIIQALPQDRAEALRGDIATLVRDEDVNSMEKGEADEALEFFREKISSLQSENDALREKNMELTQENAQLETAIYQANEMALRAESASHVKSQFLADMSHEIRTPMNAVLGMASMMEGTVLTDEQRDFVQTIRSSGETLIELINDILDFSKIEAGRIDLENIPLNPNRLVCDTVNLLRLKAEDRGIYLRGLVDSDVPHNLSGDPTRLRQILINLVGNAIKFTHKGGVEIRVKLDQGEEDKVRLQFSVKDTGIGIQADKMDRLFRPFSQVDASTTRRYGGTGLGLAISSRLCELMKGHMWVESTFGKGSTFLFTIELARMSEDALEEDDSSGPDTAQVHIDPAKVRLLLAEDNPVNSKVAILLLKRAGYMPDLAENGKEVLDAFEKKYYDVVLMDMQMPVMDGVEATRRLRKMLIRSGKKPYVIALTASVGKPDQKRCKDAGMDAFLSKPIKVNEMLELLKTAAVDACINV